MRDSSEFLKLALVLIGSSFLPKIVSSGWSMLLLDGLFWSWSTEGAGLLAVTLSDVEGVSLLRASDDLCSVPVSSTSIPTRNSFYFDFWESSLSSNRTLIDSSTICVSILYTLYPLERSEYPNIIHFCALESNLPFWHASHKASELNFKLGSPLTRLSLSPCSKNHNLSYKLLLRKLCESKL